MYVLNSLVLPSRTSPWRDRASADILVASKTQAKLLEHSQCPGKKIMNEQMNILSKYSQTDQLYKDTTGNPTRSFVPRECLCRSYLQTQCGSLTFLLLRGSRYSINRELPQCKLPLSKQNSILFIKGLVLRQINLEGTTPAWVSAPSLILIVINEMEHIFSNSA